MTLRVYQTKRQLHRKPWGSQRTPTVSITLKRLGGKSLKWLFSLSEWIQTTGKKGPILNENYHFFKKTSYMEIYSMSTFTYRSCSMRTDAYDT